MTRIPNTVSRVARLFGVYYWIWLSDGAQRNLRRKREPRDVPIDIHSLNALLRAQLPRTNSTSKADAEAARGRYVITKA